VTVPKTARVWPYSQFNICSALHTMGTGSYTMGPTRDIEVGCYCSLAGGLIVMGERHPIEDITSSVVVYDHHKQHFEALYRDYQVSPVRFHMQVPAYAPPPVIEHDVWIGQNVMLARGITIGTGSVVAGGSVVVKNVEPYTIVGGNPARVIRRRFDEKISARLLAIEWWTIDPADLLQWLQLRDPEIFLAEVEAVSQGGGRLRRNTFTPATADTLAGYLRSTAG
jgi:acetyltransferase-like isoleucine patch superfamily enzyme